MNELQMQAKCWQWHWNEFVYERGMMRRIKNELDNHPRKSARDIQVQLSENKASGIVPGTWDMLYLVPPTIWIEFKIAPNTLSPEQIEFRRIGLELNHLFFVVYSIAEFQKLIHELHS